MKANCELETMEAHWLPAPKAIMRMVLLIGPPGVGKTTVANYLSRQCPFQNVVLDGDDLAMTNPGGTDRKRLDLIERNILHCAEGYRLWGAQYCFVSWIVAHQHRLDMMEKRFRAKGIHMRAVALDAPVNVLVDRMATRPQARFAPTENNLDYLNGLRKRIRGMSRCEVLDTTGRHFTAVAQDASTLLKNPEFWKQPFKNPTLAYG